LVELRVKRLWWVVIAGWVLAGCGLLNPRGETPRIYNLALEKYDFDSLRKRQGVAGEMVISEEKAKYGEAKIFKFKSNGKWIGGTINFRPEKSSLSKVIIMIRGYADKEGYYPGSGSWRIADELAKEGYATISLDFLGYGLSDAESEDVLEARFEKVESVLDLIESVKQLPWVDKNNIGIWAHSNGGQIALSVLEVTGGNYPTVLWAPMTQKFPESVLSTIDENSPVKAIMADFEKHYDARRYAFENYYEWIEAPILIQQGTADEWCKVEWQQELQTRLRELNKRTELIIYPGSDHNLKKGWDEAVEKDVEWFEKEME